MEYNKLWETSISEESKHFSSILNKESSALLFKLGRLVSINDLSQREFIKQCSYRASYQRTAAISQLNLQEKGKKRMRSLLLNLPKSAINYPVRWHCRGQKQQFSVFVILLPPSLSSSQHSAHKKETFKSNVEWSKKKKKKKKGQNPLPEDSTDLCFHVCVREAVYLC